MGTISIPVNLSGKHIHLSEGDFRTLFGDKEGLTKMRGLMQPGQYVAKETVAIRNLQGERSLVVRIIGPFRSETQCEISIGDSRALHIADVPIRMSGDLEDSLPFIIEGTEGSVVKERGLIVAARHIHLDSTTAIMWGVENGDVVSLEMGKGNRKTTFHNVAIRADPASVPECHIDYDEGNATGVSNGDIAIVII